MKLTTVEQETLSHLTVGLTCIEIAKLCNANRTTIWRRQNRIRQNMYRRSANAVKTQSIYENPIIPVRYVEISGFIFILMIFIDS